MTEQIHFKRSKGTLNSLKSIFNVFILGGNRRYLGALDTCVKQIIRKLEAHPLEYLNKHCVIEVIAGQNRDYRR